MTGKDNLPGLLQRSKAVHSNPKISKKRKSQRPELAAVLVFYNVQPGAAAD